MEYLFQVSIGPVQDFIASARRTRDLAFGSWFLSELSRAAAHEIVKKNGLLIFPAPLENEALEKNSMFNVANKILALIKQSPDQLGTFVYEAIKERLKEIRKDAHKGIVLPKDNQEIAEMQINDLVEFLWVAFPYNEKDYEGTRQQVEALMAMRKNTRDFTRVTWGDYIPKSSIDGQLESVIPEHEYPSRRSSEAEKLAKIQRLYDHYGAGPAERLSGVDLLKRRGITAFGSHFPSTSHIATLPFLNRLEVFNGQRLEQLKKAWNGYIEKLQSLAPSRQLERIPDSYPSHPILGQFEGSMLLEDRLVDVFYMPAADTSKITRLQEAKQALRDFYQSLDDQFTALGFSKTRPNPYYALLQADGDGMGAVITAQAEHGYERHRQLSQTLAHFARKVDAIIKKHQGAPVYAGGDDVLAFLPLHTVLQCASELATHFYQELKEFPDQNGHTPTLSVGVAIVHHLDSLREARELAKEAEHRAKHIGKNALSITISKRSGEDYSIAGSWGGNDTDGGIDAYLEQLITFCRADAIPDGTAYELRDLVLRLTVSTDGQHADPTEQKIAEKLPEVIKQDALRILQRKLYVPLGKFPKGQTQEVENFLKARLGIVQKQQPHEKGTIKVTIDEFINELIIAQTLADARQLAEPKKE